MANSASWFIFFLGMGHIGYGLVHFKGPVMEALSAGYVGKFSFPEKRRTAFWFLIFGPLLMLTGQVGVHAAAQGDLALLRLVGVYAGITAALGAAAFPKSPFWAVLLTVPVLVAAGYGWLP